MVVSLKAKAPMAFAGWGCDVVAFGIDPAPRCLFVFLSFSQFVVLSRSLIYSFIFLGCRWLLVFWLFAFHAFLSRCIKRFLVNCV